ncbi:hypothetical protein MPTK1_2g21245 [Marchantia polymorpha subsp. ruderalis]|uniref:Uncharacterized protein n=1 Tax=Marchantia polymorpha subsp. ruderalis TaxID=1480154 RepID=A0A176WF54_MARPO|nr:hypothetical protein AXG93_685s1080 [Marchantia polymorpha subsp. ruderalis]
MSRADRGIFALTANRLTKKKLPVFPTLGLQRIGGRHMNYDTDYSTNFSAQFRDYIRRIEHHDHIHYEEARALAGKGQEIPFEPLDEKERRLWPVRRNTFLDVMSQGSEAPAESSRPLPKALSQVM